MRVSASVMLSSANRRAFSSRVRPLALDTERAMAFTGTCVACFQKFAIAVCSAVRVALSLFPRSLVSRYAVANAALVIAGGGAGRNWSGLLRAKGFTLRHHGSAAAWSRVGVGRHLPASVLPG